METAGKIYVVSDETISALWRATQEVTLYVYATRSDDARQMAQSRAAIARSRSLLAQTQAAKPLAPQLLS